MRNFSQRANTHEDGFTLIELLVVILIIGILAVIAVPMFLNQRRAASEASLRSDMKNTATEMMTFYAKNSIEAAQPQHGRSESVESFNMGWSVIVRSSETIQFYGDPLVGTPPARRIDGDVFLENMEPFTVSDGVAVGVTNYVSTAGTREHGEFCIVGNAENTDYEIPVGSPPSEGAKYSLFYDSSAGGFYASDELPTEGTACSNYSTAA